MKPRVVLDTNILIAGLSSQLGASFALIELALAGRFHCVASPAMWLEYEAVLKRPDMVASHGLSSPDVDDILDALAGVVIPVTSHYLWRPQLRDANDEMVLEAAVNGQAAYLVTRNIRDFAPVASHWGFALLGPGAFLKLLEKPP